MNTISKTLYLLIALSMSICLRAMNLSESSKKYNDQATRALFFLVTSGNNATVGELAKLIEDGADINAHPVLLLALLNEANNPNFFKVLLEEKADPIMPDSTGETAIQYLQARIGELKKRGNSGGALATKMRAKKIEKLEKIYGLLKEAEKKKIPVAPPSPTPALTAGSTISSSDDKKDDVKK